VGHRATVDGCGKFRCVRDSIPGPSSRQRVAIPTELPRSSIFVLKVYNFFFSVYNNSEESSFTINCLSIFHATLRLVVPFSGFSKYPL
jgi:hypothetical protein